MGHKGHKGHAHSRIHADTTTSGEEPPMTTHSDPKVAALLDQAHDDLEVICAHLPAALARLADYAGRGYPSGHTGGGGGDVHLTSTEAAASRPAPHDVDLAWARTTLASVAADIADLAQLVNRYQPCGELLDAEPICISCKRLHVITDVFRTDLCRWCYGFKLDYGQQPPIAILRTKHERGRVSEADVRAALARQPTLTRNKRGKGNRQEVGA
jgi:hypothetical protein